MSYDPSEQTVIAEIFARLLRSATADGAKKLQSGKKVPWWRDEGHLVAIFSHLYKYMRGDRLDEDSGTSPLTHIAWRCLALSYQEIYGKVDPAAKNDVCTHIGCPGYGQAHGKLTWLGK